MFIDRVLKVLIGAVLLVMSVGAVINIINFVNRPATSAAPVAVDCRVQGDS